MRNLKTDDIPKELKIRIKKAQDEYWKAKAELDAAEFIIHENKTDILANNIFTDDNGERIMTARADFRISDKEAPYFLELLFEKNKESGLPVTNKEEAIDWKFKKNLIDKEMDLFVLQVETVPEKYRKDVKEVQERHKYKDRVLDLILRLDCTV